MMTYRHRSRAIVRLVIFDLLTSKRWRVKHDIGASVMSIVGFLERWII